jgi:hypothetical protein
MIHPRYHEAFCTLTSEELECCVAGLARTRSVPEISDGEEFLGHCIAQHISQAEVVMSLAQQHSVAAVTATERLIMKPIDRRTATEVHRERAAANPRAIAAPVSARESTVDMRIVRVLAESCPKRPGTKAHDLWQLYRDGMTVADFLRSGGTRAALMWDQERAFIRLALADEQPEAQAA